MANTQRQTAYLIRWQEGEDHARWHANVENVYTGEKHLFSDRNELMGFIAGWLFDETASAGNQNAAEAHKPATPPR